MRSAKRVIEQLLQIQKAIDQMHMGIQAFIDILTEIDKENKCTIETLIRNTEIMSKVDPKMAIVFQEILPTLIEAEQIISKKFEET